MTYQIDINSLYSVTFKNGITLVMTANCLLNCYLKSVDDTVDSYKEFYTYL